MVRPPDYAGKDSAPQLRTSVPRTTETPWYQFEIVSQLPVPGCNAPRLPVGLSLPADETEPHETPLSEPLGRSQTSSSTNTVDQSKGTWKRPLQPPVGRFPWHWTPNIHQLALG